MSGEGFDVEAVTRLAMSRHPGLAADDVERLAAAAKRHLVDMGELDAPELARRLLPESSGDVSAANVVAAAAVEHLAES